MKHILGLDLGPNSIGWAVIVASSSENGADVLEKVLCSGSRIIPMDAKQLGDFENGNTVSKTKDRTQKRGTRRLYERSKLRRERLHRVLSILGFLPAHYSRQLDRYGKFIAGEPKLPWTEDGQGRPCFLFHDAFDEMLDDFRRNQPDLVAEGRKVPYDWTLYFLRKKALKEKIQKEELAWILLNFNQKRGYYQARGEEEKKTASRSREYFTAQVVSDIVDTNRMYKGLKVLTVVLADGTRGKIFKKEIPDWIGQRKDIIVKVDLDKEGNVKLDEDGEPSCRFNIPTEEEWNAQWALIKTKTQKDLDDSGKTVDAYIYDTLLQMPKQKIRGKLVRTIERKYYKDELYRILEAQKKFHPELQDRNLYEACIQNLYPLNDAHRNQISGKDMIYLLVEDILFYQRPLKSKKSLVADCPYEEIVRTDEKTGEVKHYPLKCIPKSHPLFQEFRLWQFISNLRIYRKEDFVNGKKVFDVDVTSEFLKNEDDYVNLFDELNKLKNVNQKDLFKYPSFGLKKNAEKLYRWNYVEDKTYPCNETRYQMLDRLKKAEISSGFLTKDMELALWHILYSVSDREELKKALGTFAEKHGLDEKFSEVFLNIPPFEKDYGAYSCKAIKKLLPLMRMGKYWDASTIDAQTRERISKITSGEYDENIRERVREKAIHLTELSSFRGLPLWLACYVVYDRHSEIKDAGKWERPSDIDNFLIHI